LCIRAITHTIPNNNNNINNNEWRMCCSPLLFAIYMKLLFKSTIKFCAFSCLTDSSIHSPIPIAALRHHHQNTFSGQFGHSSSVTSHGALSSAFGADTHYFRSSSPAADDVAAAAAACYNRSSSGPVTFPSLLAEIKTTFCSRCFLFLLLVFKTNER
jgi:hypothetical protein